MEICDLMIEDYDIVSVQEDIIDTSENTAQIHKQESYI